MLNDESKQYAFENTEVIVSPQNRIETFGSTVFQFYLVTELMDAVNQVRIRVGRLHAERPSIITPAHYHQVLGEGFGEKAEEFMHWLREHAPDFAVLKYGFQLRMSDLQQEIVHSPVEEVVARLRERIDQSEDPLSALIQGVDEGWDACLAKFASDVIQKSAPGNMDEWRRRGLL
jgi:hypothetical protein